MPIRIIVWTRIVIAFAIIIAATPARAQDAAVRDDDASLRVTLYSAFTALQAYDAYATTLGVARGAAEANPLTRGIAANPPLVWTLKAGTTAAAIIAAESLWRRHHRRQAIALMVITNGIATAVAARNAAVLRQSR